MRWILLIFIFCSCSKNILVEQSNLQQFPCNEDSNFLNVRIKNKGSIPISKFAIITNNERILFQGLNASDSSCYKIVPFLYEDNLNTYEFYFIKKIKKQKEIGYITKISFVPIVDGDGSGKKRTREELGYGKLRNGYFSPLK